MRPTKEDDDAKDYATKLAYAKEARLSGYLIHSVYRDTWYTPDEFIESSERVPVYRGKEDFKNFRIADPEVALLKMKEDKRLLEQKIESFAIKIKDYNLAAKQNKHKYS